MTAEAFRIVHFEDFLRYTDCPQKYILGIQEPIRTQREELESILRRRCILIARASISGTLQPYEHYFSQTKREIEITIKDHNIVQKYCLRAERVISNLLDKYCYHDHRSITGLSLPTGLTEYGIRILSASDLVVTNNKTKQTELLIFQYGDTKPSEIMDKSLYRAAILLEDYRERGMEPLIIIHNLNNNSIMKYDNAALHTNILDSFKTIVKEIKMSTIYYKIGVWCSYCPYNIKCYQKMISP